MTALFPIRAGVLVRWSAAAAIVLRAACGLPVTALRHPGRPLTIRRASGEVGAR